MHKNVLYAWSHILVAQHSFKKALRMLAASCAILMT